MFKVDGPSLWSVSGMASRLAIGLGLHRRLDGTHPESMLEARRRTWWSIYNLDRLVSFSCGRPVAIHDNDIDIEVH